MATTITCANPGDVLGSAALTTSEEEIIIDGGDGYIEMRCDQDWNYLSTSSGTAFPIPANEAFRIRARTFFATTAATATLSFLQTSGA